jgi:hypothetical protein
MVTQWCWKRFVHRRPYVDAIELTKDLAALEERNGELVLSSIAREAGLRRPDGGTGFTFRGESVKFGDYLVLNKKAARAVYSAEEFHSMFIQSER